MSRMFDEALADKLDHGTTLTEACKAYGMSYDAVCTAYRRVRGVRYFDRHPRRNRSLVFDDANVELSRSMWRHGASAKDIADAVGTNVHCVETYMMRHRDLYPYRMNMRNRHRHGEVSV